MGEVSETKNDPVPLNGSLSVMGRHALTFIEHRIDVLLEVEEPSSFLESDQDYFSLPLDKKIEALLPDGFVDLDEACLWMWEELHDLAREEKWGRMEMFVAKISRELDDKMPLLILAHRSLNNLCAILQGWTEVSAEVWANKSLREE